MTAVFERCAKCGGILGAMRVMVGGEAFHPRCSHDARDHRIAELEAKRMAIIRQIDAVIWNFEHSTVTVDEHERAWRNVLAEAMK